MATFIAWHVESSWFCCLEFLKEKALKILELCRDDSCGNPEQCVELGVLQIVNVELACQLCIQLWHADSGLCCLFVPAYSSYCCSGNFLIRETQCITHSMHVMLSCGFVLCHTHSGCCYLPFISNLYGYGIQFCAFFLREQRFSAEASKCVTNLFGTLCCRTCFQAECQKMQLYFASF